MRGAAVVARAGQWSREEVLAAASGLAARLAAAGPGPVLLYGHMEPALVAGILACHLLGRPYVPVDIACPPARAAEIAELAGVTAAVPAAGMPPELRSALEGRGVTVVPAPAPATGPAARMEPPPGDPLAYVMFTSGSSGRPKGVPVRRSAVRHFCGWIGALGAPEPEPPCVLGQAPFSFDLSVMGLCLALGRGGRLFLVDREQVADPRQLFAALRASGLTVWVSTPSFARLCLAEPGFGAAMLPSLRRFLFCGEVLPPAVAAELLRRFPGAEVWNTYGPTEAAVAVTAVRVTPELLAAGGPLPVGRPAPGLRLWLCPPDGEPWPPLPDGAEGEIVVAGPQVGDGYLPGTGEGRPGFVALPAAGGGGTAYRTGDAGLVRDGLLHCLGRLDRQVKLHGYRLEPEEIEHHLRRLPGVVDAAVLVARRRGEPDHLVAFVAAAGGPPASWRAALAARLPAYALPRHLRALSPAEWPLTPNGKLDRAALERRL